MEKHRDVLQRYERADRDTIDGTVSDQGEDEFEDDSALLHGCPIVEKGNHQNEMHRGETEREPPGV